MTEVGRDAGYCMETAVAEGYGLPEETEPAGVAMRWAGTAGPCASKKRRDIVRIGQERSPLPARHAGERDSRSLRRGSARKSTGCQFRPWVVAPSGDKFGPKIIARSRAAASLCGGATRLRTVALSARDAP
jgi:hypothetical protein